MALSSIELCSSALIKLGVDGINSFEDASAEARVAARLYPIVRDAMLCAHPWSFATRGVEAKAGERVPGEVLKTWDGRITENRTWLVTGDVLCTVRVDESEFPAHFTAALVARLAAEFCLPLTENSARTERLARLAEDELRLARLVDSQQDRRVTAQQREA